MLAMLKAGIQVDNYYACEIDKYAAQTAKHNFPKIQEIGDVFNADFTQYEGIDYLIGGSPCTYWSIAQSPDKRETTASGIGWELFSQYVRALHEAKPKFFIYENNKSMSKAIRESITQTFGFEPVCINSALVSAQNRQRLYWVGKRNADGTYSKVDVEQPKDKGILLKDVLDGVTDREKGRAVIGSTGRTTEREYFKKFQGNMSFEPVGTTQNGKSYCLSAGYSNGGGENIGNYAIHTLQKGCKSMVAEPVNTTDDNKSQTIKAQYANTDVNNICKYSSTYGASGVAEPVAFSMVGDLDNRKVGTKYKAYCLAANPSSDMTARVIEPITNSSQVGSLPRPNGELSISQAFRIYDINAKSVTLKAGGGGAGGKTGLYAVPIEFDGDIPTKAVSYADGKTYKVYEVKDGQITIKEKQYPIKLQDGYYIIRKLTVSECKRLQTVPEWYGFPVSDTQAYKMLGNGWTVDVIKHILIYLKNSI